IIALWACCIRALPASADEIADQARKILQDRCGTCHGKVNPQNGLNVLDFGYLTENGYIAAGKLDESALWERVSTADEDAIMPPGQRLPEAEAAILRQWIESGALAPSEGAIRRPFISTAAMFAAVAADLRNAPREDHDRLRYFSIAHLHNNPTVSDADLRTFRAALSKLVNSLSWEPVIVLPKEVDEYGTLLRIDLVSLGWDKDNLWNRILTDYPYGMSFDSVTDDKLSGDANFVYEATGSRIPIIRADWFVAKAGVPPLYHDLLQLPSGDNAAAELEKLLSVDVVRDFNENRLVRAGFIKSNVSQHNRLVDRHPAAFGAYWKSYDFASSAGRQSLLQFPLGPKFDGNPHDRAAFEHDGGELIFNLPNGMQGYLLVDKQGARIDRGPINVVFDSKKPLGNNEVINGISCMVCHVHGMQPFQDDIRSGHGIQGTDKQKLERLFLTQEKTDRFLEIDRTRFLKSLDEATGPFQRTGPDDQTPITEFREPVGAIARQFSENLHFEDVAAELGFEEPDSLKVLFNDTSYRKFGLGVLVDGKVISRDAWEKLSPFSNYQEVSDQLGTGTPERVFE
ncbi:MAG: c-type cytochrome domain-containing protein, partial [Planctomycetaceae bacterium]